MRYRIAATAAATGRAMMMMMPVDK